MPLRDPWALEPDFWRLAPRTQRGTVVRFRGPLLFPRREWGGQRRGRQVREEELIERKCLQQRERAPEDANARKHGVFIFVASVPGYVIP